MSKRAIWNGSTDELEALIIHLANLYEIGDDCVDFDGNAVSDPQYDLLYDELRRRRPNSQAFEGQSPSDVSTDASKFKHSHAMTSLEKFNGSLDKRKEELFSWLDDCRETLDYDEFEGDNEKDPRFTLCWKRDGVAMRLYYEKGKLVRAGLRPRKGKEAEDITANARFVHGVPHTLPKPLTLEVTGEVECWAGDFDVINKKLAEEGEELRKNPRNHTAGSLRQFKDPSKTKDGKLRFSAYNIDGFDEASDYYKTEIERMEFAESLGFDFVAHIPYDYKKLIEMEQTYSSLVFGVDGVVVCVNSIEDQEQLGRHGDKDDGNPRGKVAWKFADQVKEAIVGEIIWKESRTGRVVPTIIFKDGIHLEGTTVKQATGNNLGWLERMKITVGTKVRVIKSGKIIPKIIEVVSGHGSPSYPTHSPICGTKLEIQEGGDGNIDLINPNPDNIAQRISSFTFFLENIDVLGIGEAQVERLIESGRVQQLADFFTLEKADYYAAGFTERQSILAMAAIHGIPNPSKIKDNTELMKKIVAARKSKRKVQGWKFFAALGIPQAGRTAGKAIIEAARAKHKGITFEGIMSLGHSFYESVDGVGDIMAKSICQCFLERSATISNVLEYIEIEWPVEGSLTGKTFCLSGKVEKKRLTEEIESRGGKISSSVSKSLDYLVAGEGSGSKSEKAKEYGITILTVDELEEMLS